jgi:O-acetyl-ADP-ribose deacetylase (regulator of RNase III)
MILISKQGDLIEAAINGEVDVLVHGCNCFCKMGAGFALQVKRKWPHAHYIDETTTPGNMMKLGSFTRVAALNRFGRPFHIINAYTQYSYGNDQKVHIDYPALESVFAEISQSYANTDMRVGFPMIGAGLAGGDWDKAKAAIYRGVCSDSMCSWTVYDNS